MYHVPASETNSNTAAEFLKEQCHQKEKGTILCFITNTNRPSGTSLVFL